MAIINKFASETYVDEKISGLNINEAVNDALLQAKESGEFKGESGVYVGSGEMPEEYNVQIDPNGDADIEVLTAEETKTLVVNEVVSNLPFVTPQMYGAVGDGIHDDTDAFKTALAENNSVFVPSGNYVISDTLDISYKKSLYSDDGKRATILYDGNNSVILINRMSIFRNIDITIKNAFTGTVFDINNRGNITSANGGCSRVEHSNVKFEVKSPNAILIGITADSGTDVNNIPKQSGVCFQTFHDITVDSSKGYGYGIKMELIQGRAFTEDTKTGFPWITHIDYDDIYLGQPQTAIKAGVTNTSGSEYFNRIGMGNILFNNVYTQFRDGDTEKFLDVEHFGGYFTKCIGWDYHHYTNAGNKVNIIGEDVTACFSDCQLNFGRDFLQTCDFTAETEYTVADNPEYFINKYFNGTVLSKGYDTIDAKIQAKLNDEYIGNIAEEKINDVLYTGYANVMNDPLTQIKDGYRFSNSSQEWSYEKDMITIVIPIVVGGNIIRWTPSEYKLSNGYKSVFFFNDDQLTNGVIVDEHSNLWIEKDGMGYLKVDNPSSYRYVSIPFEKLTIVDSYDTPIISINNMIMTINREISNIAGKSYTEYLRDSVIYPAITEEFGKITIPTKTSQLTNDSGFLTQHQDISGKADKSSAETWTFTLTDGSTVTKKVVLA